MPLLPSECWTLSWEQSGETNVRTTDDVVEEQFWQENAAGFDEKHPLAPLAGEIMQEIYPHLRGEDHLIEIGSGTGGFTQLLAPYVQAVTVIEPSAAMMRVFRSKWAETPSRSLPIMIQAKWENVPEAEADVLFSANAFYRIRDMKEALAKMHRTAKRHVFLIQSVGRPNTKPLQVSLNGETFEWERATALSNILFVMGILHRYRSFQVKRRNGTIHEVALIDWNTIGCRGGAGT